MRKPLYCLLLMISIIVYSSCKKSSAADQISPKLSKLKKITLSPDRNITFTYDSKGQIIQSAVSDSVNKGWPILNNDTWSFIYDQSGRLIKVSNNKGRVVEVTTNEAGYITSASLRIEGSFVFGNSLEYNISNQITAFSLQESGGADYFTFDYSPEGNLQSVSRTGSRGCCENFSVSEMAFDNKSSTWRTDVQSTVIYWWLLNVASYQTRFPTILLSYKNNVTKGIYRRNSEQIPFKIEYIYNKDYPVFVKMSDQSTFQGFYKIEYTTRQF